MESLIEFADLVELAFAVNNSEQLTSQQIDHLALIRRNPAQSQVFDDLLLTLGLVRQAQANEKLVEVDEELLCGFLDGTLPRQKRREVVELIGACKSTRDSLVSLARTLEHADLLRNEETVFSYVIGFCEKALAFLTAPPASCRILEPVSVSLLSDGDAAEPLEWTQDAGSLTVAFQAAPEDKGGKINLKLIISSSQDEEHPPLRFSLFENERLLLSRLVVMRQPFKLRSLSSACYRIEIEQPDAPPALFFLDLAPLPDQS